ncbi:MAG: hypothetical protein AAGI30_01210 [Planctomycetota bacterium]
MNKKNSKRRRLIGGTGAALVGGAGVALVAPAGCQHGRFGHLTEEHLSLVPAMQESARESFPEIPASAIAIDGWPNLEGEFDFIAPADGMVFVVFAWPPSGDIDATNVARGLTSRGVTAGELVLLTSAPSDSMGVMGTRQAGVRGYHAFGSMSVAFFDPESAQDGEAFGAPSR